MIILIIRASNILSVDELQLFKLAYRSWYDRKPESHDIHPVFNHYLEKKIAPPWVVHFARTVLQAYQSGNFDPARFGIHQESNDLAPRWSLVFKIPRSVPLNDADDTLIA